MTKKWLASLLAKTGLAQPASAEENVQMVDPKSILFTLPTISNDFPPLEPIGSSPQNDDTQMHEDDWCQVEFFRKSYLPELERILKEYKVFEASNRDMITIQGEQCPVWRNTYVREVAREPLLSGDEPLAQLAKIVGGPIGPAPVLFSASSWSGRVENGFTMLIGRNVYLYGYRINNGIPILAASVGQDPDDQSLTTAFGKLNAALGLVLVDWRSQFILVDTSPDGNIRTWQP